MNDFLLTVTVASASPDAVLELVGELDLSSVSPLISAIESIEPGARSVTLDLSGLTFLDSTGLGLIARMNVDLGARGCTVALIGPPPNVLRTLQLVGLDGLVEVPA